MSSRYDPTALLGILLGLAACNSELPTSLSIRAADGNATQTPTSRSGDANHVQTGSSPNVTQNSNQPAGATAGTAADSTTTPAGGVCAAAGPCKLAGVRNLATGICTYANMPDGTVCNDGNLCTLNEACAAGVCSGGTAVVCQATDGCHTASTCRQTTGCTQVLTDTACALSPTLIPLKGCSSAIYWAPFTIGQTPSVQLLIDTGSAKLAAASNVCSNCSGLSPLYVPGSSAQAKNVSYTVSYGGNTSSWTGALYSDIVTFGDATHGMTVGLAAIASHSQFFKNFSCDGVVSGNDFQGILGLAGSSLNTDGFDAYSEKLVTAQQFKDTFAVQMCDVDGRLWFGGYDPAYVSAAPQFTPMNTATGFFNIGLTDAQLGGRSLSLSAGDRTNIMVDTGSTLTTVSSTFFNKLAAMLEADAEWNDLFEPGDFAAGVCRIFSSSGSNAGLSRADIDGRLPELTLAFPSEAGGTFSRTLPATSSYLFAYVTPDTKQLAWCVSFTKSDTLTPYRAIFGHTLLNDNVVIFDRAHGRLGFAAQKSCIKTYN